MDARKTALKAGLRQLHVKELQRLLEHVHYGGKLTLDNLNYSTKDQTYCPLAVAVGLPQVMRGDPSDSKVTGMLKLLGLKVYNTRGVHGDYYTTNRREDLYNAILEVLWERHRMPTEFFE